MRVLGILVRNGFIFALKKSELRIVTTIIMIPHDEQKHFTVHH